MNNILLTCVGGDLAPLVIKNLKDSVRHKNYIIGVDESTDAVGQFFTDKFDVVPSGDDDAYVEEIFNKAVKYGCDLILPMADGEAISLSREKDKFTEAGISVACPNFDATQIIQDKAETYKELERAGIKTPYWRLVDSLDNLFDIVTNMHNTHGDYVVKPVKGRGGRGVFIVHSKFNGEAYFDDARDMHIDHETFVSKYIPKVASLLPVIVMEKLGGPGWDIDILSWNGVLQRAVPRRRIIASGTPFKGCVIENNQSLIRLAEDICELFSLSWLQDIDLMSDIEGNPYIMEINPRPSGGVCASISAGIPLLDDIVSLAVGEQLPQIDIPNDMTIYPYTALTRSYKK